MSHMGGGESLARCIMLMILIIAAVGIRYCCCSLNRYCLSRQSLFHPHSCAHNRILHVAQHILMLAGTAAMEVDEDGIAWRWVATIGAF